MPDPIGQNTEDAAYLAAVVNSSHDAIITKSLSGIIKTWNTSAERIFGYTAEEAVNQSTCSLFRRTSMSRNPDPCPSPQR